MREGAGLVLEMWESICGIASESLSVVVDERMW
jgi:hypothetical protein